MALLSIHAYGTSVLQTAQGSQFSGFPYMQAAIQAGAKALGVSASALMSALHDGTDLAQLAQLRGVSPTAVQEAMTQAAQQSVSRAAQGGTLSDSQAANLLQRLQGRIATLSGSDAGTPTDQTAIAVVGSQTTGLLTGNRGSGQVFQATMRAAAQALGLSEPEMLSAMRSGMSIGRLAQQQGVSLDTLQGAMNQAAGQQLSLDVQSGAVSQSQQAQLQGQFQGLIGAFVRPDTASVGSGNLVNAFA